MCGYLTVSAVEHSWSIFDDSLQISSMYYVTQRVQNPQPATVRVPAIRNRNHPSGMRIIQRHPRPALRLPSLGHTLLQERSVSTPIATISVDCGFLGFWLQPPLPSSPLLPSMASAVAHSCTLTPWSHKFHLLRNPHSVSSIAPSAILRLGDAPVIARLNVARARVRTLPLVSLIAGRRRVCRFGGVAVGG